MSGPFVAFEDTDCENQAPAGVGTTVAEVVATLSADPRLNASTAEDVTIAGQIGQMIDLQVAPGWTGTCNWSQGNPALLILSATDTGPAVGIGGTERARFIFLDVGDAVVSINFISPDVSTFEASSAQAMPIIETVRFSP